MNNYTNDQINEMVIRVQRGENDAANELRKVLSVLVNKCVLRQVGKQENKMFNTLREAGFDGLMQAAKGYDASCGHSFRPYAVSLIRKNISEVVKSEVEKSLSKIDNIPASTLQEMLGDLEYREREIISRVFELEGSSQSLEEIGKEFGLTPERAEQIKKRALEKLAMKIS